MTRRYPVYLYKEERSIFLLLKDFLEARDQKIYQGTEVMKYVFDNFIKNNNLNFSPTEEQIRIMDKMVPDKNDSE